MESATENLDLFEDTFEESSEEEREADALLLFVECETFAYTGTSTHVKVGLQCVDESRQIEEGTVVVLNDLGEEVASAALNRVEEDEEEKSWIAEVDFIVPLEAGEYSYCAVYREIAQSEDVDEIEFEDDELDYFTTFSIEVREHIVALSAWGIQAPIIRGESFLLKVGARCPGNCSLSGAKLGVFDEAGTQIAEAVLGEEVLAGTSGTHYSEIELNTPDDEAVHTWKIDLISFDENQPHQIQEAEFFFRTIAQPEFEVTVKVVDFRDKKPIEECIVMIGFKRSYTDKNGIAIIEASPGKQAFEVILDGYRSVIEERVISGTESITVELTFDPTI